MLAGNASKVGRNLVHKVRFGGLCLLESFGVGYYPTPFSKLVLGNLILFVGGSFHELVSDS